MEVVCQAPIAERIMYFDCVESLYHPFEDEFVRCSNPQSIDVSAVVQPSKKLVEPSWSCSDLRAFHSSERCIWRGCPAVAGGR
jgi:hypothetical protein